MRAFTVILLACISVSAFGSLAGAGKPTLRQLEKDLSRKIRVKLLERASIIPDLPPRIEVDDTEINFDDLIAMPELVTGTASIQEIVLIGLDTLTDDLRINIDDPCNIRFEFDLTLNQFTIEGKYLADFTLLDTIRILGATIIPPGNPGTVDIAIIDGTFSLGGNLLVDISNDRASLSGLLLSADVEAGSKINLQGLRINGIPLVTIPAALIKTILGIALPIVQTEVTTIVNDVLAELEWSSLDPTEGCDKELPIASTDTDNGSDLTTPADNGSDLTTPADNGSDLTTPADDGSDTTTPSGGDGSAKLTSRTAATLALVALVSKVLINFY